jgi:hypothetical protein
MHMRRNTAEYRLFRPTDVRLRVVSSGSARPRRNPTNPAWIVIGLLAGNRSPHLIQTVSRVGYAVRTIDSGKGTHSVPYTLTNKLKSETNQYHHHTHSSAMEVLVTSLQGMLSVAAAKGRVAKPAGKRFRLFGS